MAGEELEQTRKIALLPNQLQSKLVVRQETLSDIQVYKEILCEKFALAKTADECERLIELRQKIHELDTGSRRLDYAEKSAEVQLQEAKQKAFFQRGQQVVASIVSVGIGIYFIQAAPLAGLLFLVLGLARPLGYSLGEISDLLDGLKGFPKDSDELIPSEKEQEIQSEEARDARP
jgi:hypothetical protein